MIKDNLYFYKNISYYIYFIIGISIILFDRITKLLALSYNLNYLGRFQRLFHLPPLKNTGLSLQLLMINNKDLFFILEIIGFIIICYYLYQLKKKINANEKIIGEVLVISGGIANLIDRLYYDAVIDFIFIQMPLINYIAIANIADIAITIGCIILMLELFFSNN